MAKSMWTLDHGPHTWVSPNLCHKIRSIWLCRRSLCVMSHSSFLSLELRGPYLFRHDDAPVCMASSMKTWSAKFEHKSPSAVPCKLFHVGFQIGTWCSTVTCGCHRHASTYFCTCSLLSWALKLACPLHFPTGHRVQVLQYCRRR